MAKCHDLKATRLGCWGRQMDRDMNVGGHSSVVTLPPPSEAKTNEDEDMDGDYQHGQTSRP